MLRTGSPSRVGTVRAGLHLGQRQGPRNLQGTSMYSSVNQLFLKIEALAGQSLTRSGLAPARSFCTKRLGLGEPDVSLATEVTFLNYFHCLIAEIEENLTW